MDLGLEGRTALVLGATSGLGLASASVLSSEGAEVIVGGRRLEAAQATAEGIGGIGAVEVDLTRPASVESGVADALNMASIDIVVLNGGGPPRSDAASVGVDAMTAASELLFYGHVRILGAVLPGMRERAWGRIVAVGSSGVVAPITGLSMSNTFRSALAAHLKTLASEVARDGVTVNMVHPGRIDTPRVQSLDEARANASGVTVADVSSAAARSIPAGRYGRPGEFGDAVAFLCSDRAGYITGVELRVDGGMVNCR